jgi:hypothetical protein
VLAVMLAPGSNNAARTMKLRSAKVRCAGQLAALPSGDAGLRPIGHSAITGSLGCSGRIALHVTPNINVGYGTDW